MKGIRICILPAYGNRFGVLDIYGNVYMYSAEKLSPDILDFEQYSFDVFYSEYYAKQLAKNKLLFLRKVSCRRSGYLLITGHYYGTI